MGSSSFHISNAKILHFRVSSINFLRPGLEAFGRDTGTRDSPTALVSNEYFVAVFEGFHCEETSERGFAFTSCILSWEHERALFKKEYMVYPQTTNILLSLMSAVLSLRVSKPKAYFEDLCQQVCLCTWVSREHNKFINVTSLLKSSWAATLISILVDPTDWSLL